MNETLQRLPQLVRETFQDPRGTVRQLIAQDYPVPSLWQALALLVILIVLLEQALFQAAGGLAPLSEDLLEDPLAVTVWTMQELFYTNPLPVAGLQLSLCVVSVLALHRVGRAFGGTGDLGASLTTFVWFLTIYFGLSLLTVLTTALVPFLAGFVALGVVVINAWLATQFTCALHEFDKPFAVFFGIVVTAIALTFAMAIVSSFFLGDLIGAPNGI